MREDHVGFGTGVVVLEPPLNVLSLVAVPVRGDHGVLEEDASNWAEKLVRGVRQGAAPGVSSNDEEDEEEDEEEEEEEEDAASGCSMVDQAANLRSGLCLCFRLVTLCGLLWAATTGKTELALECLARARVFLLALDLRGKGDLAVWLSAVGVFPVLRVGRCVVSCERGHERRREVSEQVLNVLIE